MTTISISRRLRRTPFSEGVRAAGVKGYTVYNHMLLPTFFASLEEDYWHLKSAVQVWDVACERQVEIAGPDADRLVRMLTPRDISKMADNQCFYVPVVNTEGGMLNDPVALRPDGERWWISIADSDLLFWVMGLAVGMRLNVTVREPDVSPLAVQGPKAEDLMARVFGDAVRGIRFFRHKRLEFQGKTMVVARSGYSKQGGFEIYVEGAENGMPLWNALFEAGRDLDVRAGCPNLIERVEGGLLSYGNDMTSENTPFECGLGKYCNSDGDYIGRAALEHRREPGRMIRPLTIDGPALMPPSEAWRLSSQGRPAGQVTSAIHSPDAGAIVAIGMVDAAFWGPGEVLTVETPDGPREARVEAAFRA